MCGAKSALLPSRFGANLQSLLCTWKGAMQSLLRTWSGDTVSGTKKIAKIAFLPTFKNYFVKILYLTTFEDENILRESTFNYKKNQS